MTTPGPERLASLWAAKMRALQQPAPAVVSPAPPARAEEITPSPEGISPAPTQALAEGEGDGLTRDQRRSRRKRETKARTVNLRVLRSRGLGFEPELYPEQPGTDYTRPATRGDCEGTERPCPFVSCKYHLYLDVSDNGSIKLNFPDIEVWEMPESCILDLAAREGMTLEEVGTILNITRERVRQLESRAERRLQRRASFGTGRLAEIARDFDIGGKRRLPLLPTEVDDPEDETDPADEEEDDALDDEE